MIAPWPPKRDTGHRNRAISHLLGNCLLLRREALDSVGKSRPEW